MPTDPLRRFYSRALVGEVLVRILPPMAPGTVLDLCSGTGRLNAPFSGAWPDAVLVTVDSDPLAPGGAWPASRTRHHFADGLSLAPGDGIVPHGGFGSILCNPPYGPMACSVTERAILAAAGLPSPVGNARLIDAAMAFTGQALALASPGAVVALVLPDGLVTGRRAAGFRAALARAHAILDVVQLPGVAFDRTEARAFVVVLRKGAPADAPIRLRAVDAKGAFGPVIGLPPSLASGRLDHSYHAAMASGGSGATLRDLGAEVVRGRVRPGHAGPGGMPVFHTGDFPRGEARHLHALPTGSPGAGEILVAGPGDILIACVDRALHRKVCLVGSGHAAPTTFVLRVRVPPEDRDGVARALISAEGEARLRATARGVGSRMLGREDLLAMPLP